MFKNTASQKIQLFAFDATTGVAKTGDAANLTAYVSIDYGAVTVLGDTTATEMDATNAPGWYMFDLTQAETNGNDLLFTAKSSTANIKVVGRPVCTVPASFQAQVAQTGDSFPRIGAPAGASVSADVAAIKAVLPSALGANGNIKADVRDFNGTAGAFASGRPEVNTTHAAGTAWGSGAITAASIAADAITAAKIADGAIDAATFAAGAINAAAIASDAITDAKVASDVTIASVTGAVGSVTGNVGGNVTGSVGSVVGAVGSVTGLTASDVGAIKAKTDNLPSDPADQSLIIAATNSILSDTNAIKGVTDKLDDTLEDDGGTYRFTANALEEAPSGTGASAATIAAAVWSESARTLTAIDEDSTTLDLDATIRAAVGMASANMDTQLDALPTATENADALLNRDMSAVSDTNARSPLNALRHIRNKWSLSGTTLTVTKEDDSTTAWTATMTTNASADPITGSDPA